MLPITCSRCGANIQTKAKSGDLIMCEHCGTSFSVPQARIIISGGTVIANNIVAGDLYIENREKKFPELLKWRDKLHAQIEKNKVFSLTYKIELKSQISRIVNESIKCGEANPKQIEQAFDTLALRSEDTFEIAISSLPDALSKTGLIIKREGRKIRVEK